MPKRRAPRPARTARPASCIRVVARPGRAQGSLLLGNAVFACAIGRGGCVRRKREGDGATPVGRWPIRSLLFRPDRGPRPTTALATRPIRKTDGWCDDPRSRAYNSLVRLPARVHHEAMWRADRLYDRVVVVGYNDAPALPGRGSAIFIHAARDGYEPTEGCVALSSADLGRLIFRLGRRSTIRIGTEPAPRPRPLTARRRRGARRR